MSEGLAKVMRETELPTSGSITSNGMAFPKEVFTPEFKQALLRSGYLKTKEPRAGLAELLEKDDTKIDGAVKDIDDRKLYEEMYFKRPDYEKFFEKNSKDIENEQKHESKQKDIRTVRSKRNIFAY